MVSTATIASILVSLILSILLPAFIAVYFYKKYRISFKPVWVGALIFFVFVLILERMMHQYLLVSNTTTAIALSDPWAFAAYGAFAAGIFEEVGRFVGYKLLLKGHTERKDGLAYGIGHGGIEAILVGGVAAIQNLYFSLLLNKGTLESSLGAKVPQQTVLQIKNVLISTPSYTFLLSGFERAFALSIQILLSLVVLYGIKERKYIFLLYAILIHAAVDFPAALFQKGMFSNMWVMEGIYGVIAVIFLICIIKSKKYFSMLKL